MSVALAARVQGAVDGLGETERTALDLRSRSNLDYAAIGAQLGTGREAVADLLVSARLGVAAALRGEALPPRRTPQCGPARRVLAARADGEAVTASDTTRAREHVEGCEPCQAARLALREAELSCRTWAATPPDALAAHPSDDPAPSVSPSRGDVPDHATRRPRWGRLAAALVALVLLIAVAAAVLGGDDASPAPRAPRTQQGSASAPGKDVIPPPGDTPCPSGQTGC